MTTKTKNSVIVLAILLGIVIVGGVVNFVYLRGKINDKQQKIKDLKVYQLDTEQLKQQLEHLQKRVAVLDSILANRKHIIPFNLPQTSFYDFVNEVSFGFSPYSFLNIEYDVIETAANYNHYVYNLSGVAEYNDLYNLIYAIEESKQLKKISALDLTSNVKVDEDGTPHYLVSFKFKAQVFYSGDERFSVKDSKENSLTPNPVFDIFYPLIRNEIPSNVNGLLDVQSAQLLALIPDGAFFSDATGNTFLLWEGDKVYLGYLTNINYSKSQVNFVLNKGGIIENVTLELHKEKKENKVSK